MLEEKNVFHGPKSLIEVKDGTAGEQIYKAFIKNANIPVAMVNSLNNESVSYISLLTTTCHLAKCFENYGLTINSVISICSDNSLNFFYPVIAALYNGIIVAPLNENYSERELHNALNTSRPDMIFCSKKSLLKIIELKKRYPIKKIVILDSIQNINNEESLHNFILNNCDIHFDAKKFKPANFNRDEQTAFIFNSSGTTGLPKGVIITHKNIVFRFAQSRDPNAGFGINISPGSSVLNMMPFFHAYGLLTTLEFLLNGFKVILLNQFDPDLYLKSIQDHKVETSLTVPTVMVFLAKSPLIDKYDLSTLKELGCAAATLSKDIQDTVIKRLNLKGIRQGYGLTESTLGITIMPENQFRLGSSGKLLSFSSGKVVDIKTGKNLGPNKTGELCFKGELIMKGYMRNPEATKGAFDENGWLKTGDIGYFDSDGFIYIVGRLKELIKYKAFQVPPAELEALLLEHPSVKEAAVVGIPDEVAGELPAALVVLQPGKHLTEKEIQDYVAGQVSSAKRLRGGVRFLNEIPKSSTGKYLRPSLVELFQNQKFKL